MLPREGTLSRRWVIERKCGANDNPEVRANDNTILDSQYYLVEFEDSEVTELAANIIYESIYAMCDP